MNSKERVKVALAFEEPDERNKGYTNDITRKD